MIMRSVTSPAPRTRAPIAAALTAAALLVSGCGGVGRTAVAGDAAVPVAGGTVHMLQTSDFSYLDPARGFDGGVNAFYRLIYRGLTMQTSGDAPDPNAIVPDLAEALGTPSADGLSWTYRLKEGLRFDDGSALTSAEVAFGLSRAWDPEIGIGSPYLVDTIAAPQGYAGPYRSGPLPTIETPDPRTVIFRLKAPYPEFDNVLAQPNAVPFPQGSGAGEAFINDVIASGPYTVQSYTPGSRIRLERNPHWDPASDAVRRALPDAWEFHTGLDGATIDERLLAGQGADRNAIGGKIQTATLARVQTPQLQQRVRTAPAYCTTYMSMNTSRAPFDRVEVRQAVNWAIDRTSLVTASGGPRLTDPATTIIPTSVTGHADFDLYPGQDGAGDQARARELLAAAGVPDGFSFTLDIRSNPAMQAQAEALQQSLARVGIEVALNVIDVATYYETIATPALQNDAALTGWCPDWASSASTFVPPLFDGRRITEKGNTNLAQFNDPAVNARIDEIRATTDLAAANAAWGELDAQIMASAPIAPLLQEKGIFLPGTNVGGYLPSTSMTDLTIVGLLDPTVGS